MDDTRIVELFLARDESAIAETAAKYGPRLTALALRVISDPREAEECVNDAYLRAWELIPPAEPRDHLFAFLGKIVRGLAIDRVRAASSQKRSAVLVELTKELSECLPSGAGVEQEAEANELAALISAFINALSEEKRLIFLRRYWYFDSVAEVAAVMGISQSKVKTELFRMRKKLKAYLERNGYTV